MLHVRPALIAVALLLSACAGHLPKSGVAGMESGLAAMRVADYGLAYREFLPVAQQGHPVAQFYVGNLYREGWGVGVDGVEARRWYRLSAERGYALAQHHLALMYATGRGGPQDFREARRWAERAAAQGSSGALESLGTLYMTGRGVPQDIVRAYVYYSLATNYTYEGERLSTNAPDYRERAKARLSQSDLAQAEETIRGWRPKHETVVFPSGSPSTTPAPPPPPAVAAPPAPSIPAPRTNASTSGPDVTGTGFVVSGRGHVITNHHVVTECREVRTGLPSEDRPAARLLSADQTNDLALLHMPMPGGSAATFRDGQNIRPGDGVVVVGYPLRGLLASNANVTTGTISALAGVRDDSRLLQLTAPIQPGNSGRPLLDLSGNVVGVIVSTLKTAQFASVGRPLPQNVNFALNSSVVRAFLEANGVEHKSAPSSTTMSAADVGEQAKKYTVVVECWK